MDYIWLCALENNTRGKELTISGRDPAPEETATFNSDITCRKVKVLLHHSQVTYAQPTAIKQTATKAGPPIVGVSETIPARYPTFQAWQIAQAKSLLATLGG